MKRKDQVNVRECVEIEGFDYCFRYYSTFDDIKDKEFHVLREAYIKAAQALIDYVGLDD